MYSYFLNCRGSVVLNYEDIYDSALNQRTVNAEIEKLNLGPMFSLHLNASKVTHLDSTLEDLG